MTNSQIEKVLKAMDEVAAMLKKETDYQIHLQNTEKVSFLRSHLAMLSGMLEENARSTYLAA